MLVCEMCAAELGLIGNLSTLTVVTPRRRTDDKDVCVLFTCRSTSADTPLATSGAAKIASLTTGVAAAAISCKGDPPRAGVSRSSILRQTDVSTLAVWAVRDSPACASRRVRWRPSVRAPAAPTPPPLLPLSLPPPKKPPLQPRPRPPPVVRETAQEKLEPAFRNTDTSNVTEARELGWRLPAGTSVNGLSSGSAAAAVSASIRMTAAAEAADAARAACRTASASVAAAAAAAAASVCSASTSARPASTPRSIDAATCCAMAAG